VQYVLVSLFFQKSDFICIIVTEQYKKKIVATGPDIF